MELKFMFYGIYYKVGDMLLKHCCDLKIYFFITHKPIVNNIEFFHLFLSHVRLALLHVTEGSQPFFDVNVKEAINGGRLDSLPHRILIFILKLKLA